MVDDLLIGIRLVESFLTVANRSRGLEKLRVHFRDFLHFHLHQLELLCLHAVNLCRCLWSLAYLGLHNWLVCLIAVVQGLRNTGSLL